MSRALSGARAKLDSALGVASASTSFAQPSKRDSNLCLSLLPLFNFGADPSKVTHADWQRGTRAMGLFQLADDPTVWAYLIHRCMVTGQRRGNENGFSHAGAGRLPHPTRAASHPATAGSHLRDRPRQAVVCRWDAHADRMDLVVESKPVT